MSTPKPVELSDLIFSDTISDVNKVLGDIRRSTLSVGNRLRSIEHDAAFAREVAKAYGLPLVANERCGSWYIAPDDKAQSAYFKSTDGHNGQWSFSLRRLNLQVLETTITHAGCVIVDSTRRGKSMPDALSKTVPIWTCVLNRHLFPNLPESHELRTPPNVISQSEHSQIESRIEGFVQQLKSLNLDLTSIRANLRKPLLPIWITHSSNLPPSPPSFQDFHPIVLCTASRQVPGGESSEEGYIQGAADDSESWAHGLTAPIFWKHKEALLASSEDELPGLIATLSRQEKSSNTGSSSSSSMLIRPTRRLYISDIDTAKSEHAAFDLIITCGPQSAGAEILTTTEAKVTHVHLVCGPGKIGSRQLRHELPKLTTALEGFLSEEKNAASRILVACPTGKDHSVGAALAVLCLYADDEGALRSGHGESKDGHQRAMNKHFIKQRLSWIMVSIPDANPARATLQSVNAFLLA